MAEEEILFREMDWVRQACYRIDRDKRRAARLTLSSLLAAMGAGFSGSMDGFEGLMEALEDEVERGARLEAEQAELERKLADDRAERAAMMLAGGQGFSSQ